MTFDSIETYNALPPVFYKYMAIGPWLEAFIAGDSIRFSTRMSFNDPFDCRPAFRIGDGREVRKYINDGLKSFGMTPAKRLMAMSRASRLDPDFFSTQATAKHLDEVGILCLAPAWDNSLMWSHYSDHHRGICIGFHSDIDIFKTALKVFYQEDLPIVTAPTTRDRELYDKVFMTKARCWEYEQEWRIIKVAMTDEARDSQYRDLCCYVSPALARSLSNQRGAGIYNFDKSAIQSLTLGMKISNADEERIRQAVRAAGLDVPIYRISQPERSYSLSRTLLP